MGWNDDDDIGPWGRKNTSKPSPSQEALDLESLLKKGQDYFRNLGGGKGPRGNFMGLAVLGGLLLWAGTGFYRVQEGEKAVVLRFGEMVRITEPGLRYHLPVPIEDVRVIKVSQINVLKSGHEVVASNSRSLDLRGENVANLMLTGDENIVKIRFNVQWFIKDIANFLFNDPDPRETVQVAAESAVREVIAQTTLIDILTVGKDKIIQDSKRLLQKLLDEYHIGIEVVKINLEEVNPPDSVLEAFRDVQRARADRERTVNEAKAYRNSKIPVTRGKAQEIIKEAEGDKQAWITQAQGETQRFLSVLAEYRKAPDITLLRLRIQNSEKVLQGIPKYIVSGDRTTQGILPYLPLNAVTPSQPMGGKK